MRVLVFLFLAACGTNLAPTASWQPADGLPGTSIGAPASAVATFTGTLRVATFNIQDGGAPPDEIARAFLADPGLAHADVVLLQEEEAFPEEAMPRAAELAQRLGMGWFYAPARPLDTGTFGDAILSRFPMSELEVIDLPHAENKLQRIALRAALDVGGTTVSVTNTHLDTTINFTTRVLQIHPAVIDAPPCSFVGGDFNTNPYLWEHGDVPVIPDSVVVDTDQARLLDGYMSGLGFASGTAALGDTETKDGVASRLDSIYARELDASGGAVVRSIGLSDHWPVWVDLRIQP